MADNCSRTPGSGEDVAADEVTDGVLGSVKVQYVKIMDGTIDGTDKAHVDGTNGLAVEVKALPAVTATHLDIRHLNATDDAVVLGAGAEEIGKLAAGTATIGKLGANSGVDIGDTDVTSVIPGTAATNLGKAEDAAHASGDVGVMALAVRKDVAVATAAAADDYVPLQTDAEGRLWVNDRPPVIWSAFHDAAAAHTDIALQAAPGAGLSLYVTDFIVTNDSTLAITIKLEEDTASGKTAKTAIQYVPKDGGFVMKFETPIKLTADKDLGFTSTGTSNFGVEVHGFTAP